MSARTRPRTHVERVASRDGYFAPESVIRRVGNSPLTPLLGGGPAVLLQVAHPLVAVGVVEHSDYRRDLWSRLRRTLQALYLITYGTRAEADRAGEAVRAVHASVHGTTTAPLGRYPAGTPYSAADPELMLWVHATLVECSLAAYQRFVERLGPGDQERYYREMRIVARIFGVPGSVLPRALGGFREYFDSQIAGETITVTPPAQDVANVILAADLPAPMRVLAPAHRLASAGLLPARLRREYGLRWDPLRAHALPWAARAMRVATLPAMRAASHRRRPHAAADSAI
ncbi:MAG TPA: oxygenase MpaB family protein [Gaiellales bacterium]|nr:oxygenase MpaB family protein [Gaiellales bacterium]